MGNTISDEQQRENRIYGYEKIGDTMENCNMICNKNIELKFRSDDIIIYEDKKNKGAFILEFENYSQSIEIEFKKQLTNILNFYERNNSICKRIVRKDFCDQSMLGPNPEFFINFNKNVNIFHQILM